MTRGGRVRPHPLIVPIVRRLLMPLLSRRARLSAEGIDAFDLVSPPYIVVANHVSFWDPFWVNVFIRHPIQFVASDNLFRTPFLGRAMRLLGAIPKTKLMNDPETVRQIVGVVKQGGVIGLFPEGARTHDGRPLDLVPAVARLLRMLRVPVVGARIMGGYLSRPRWARHRRRAEVRISYSLLFSGQELGQLSLHDILAGMRRHIGHDEMVWQKTRGMQIRARRPAEHLERLLFVCPACRSVSTLQSRDDCVRCTACGHAVRVNDRGFFEPCAGPLFFDSLAEWSAWQLPVFEQMLAAGNTFRPSIFEERARLLEGWRTRPLRALDRGTARLTRARIVVRGRRETIFPLGKLVGVNVQNGEKLEFYRNGTLYRLDFPDPRASSYKWAVAIGILTTSTAQSAAQDSSRILENTYDSLSSLRTAR